MRLADDVRSEIDNSMNAYMRAADMVRVHRAFAMPAADLLTQVLGGLLLDVVALRFTAALIKGVTAAQKNAVQLAKDLEISNPQGLASMSMPQVTPYLTASTAKARALAGLALNAPSDADTKTASEAFLNELKSAARVGFHTLKEEIPGTSDDVALIAYRESLLSPEHNDKHYEAEINKLLDQYLESGIGRIGRASGRSQNRERRSAKDEGSPFDGEDVYVAWARFASGYPRRLVFTHADTQVNSLTPSQDDRHQGDQSRSAQLGFPGDKGVRLVPQNLEETALSRQRAIWGEPTEIDVDDSAWYFEPGRVAAAYDKRNRGVLKGNVHDGPLPSTKLPTRGPTERGRLELGKRVLDQVTSGASQNQESCDVTVSPTL